MCNCMLLLCAHTSPTSLSPVYSPLPTCRPPLPLLLQLVPHTQSWWSTSIWWNWQVHLRGRVVLRRWRFLVYNYVQWWHDVVLRRWRRGQIWFCTYTCILWYDGILFRIFFFFVPSVRACCPAWLWGRSEWIRSVVMHYGRYMCPLPFPCHWSR